MSRIIEKYLDVFPTIVFLCSDDLHPMHFILSLKNMPDARKEELVRLLLHCGAEVSFSVEEAHGHSAIIVDHDEVVTVNAPAFKISYLRDSLQNAKVQNITDYRQATTKHIAENADCMDIVYFRKQSWDSVLTKAEKQWFSNNENAKMDDENKETDAYDRAKTVRKSVNGKSGNLKTIGDDDGLPTQAVDSESDNESAGHLEKGENDKYNPTAVPSTSATSPKKWGFRDEFHQESSDDDDIQPKEKKKKETETEKENKSRLPYSYEEQCKILKYVVEHFEYSRVKGRDLWMIMERRKICPGRTWQSMKEHFIKKIVNNLEAFDFLTKSDKQKIKNALF